MLLELFALPPPAMILASLIGSSSYKQLHHRWLTFPAVSPASQALEQSLQRREPALRSPRLMHLPNQFQVCYQLLTNSYVAVSVEGKHPVTLSTNET